MRAQRARGELMSEMDKRRSLYFLRTEHHYEMLNYAPSSEENYAINTLFREILNIAPYDSSIDLLFKKEGRVFYSALS